MSNDDEPGHRQARDAGAPIELKDVPPVPVRLLQSDAQIVQAIEDAALLLAFAVQSQRNLKSDIISTLTATVEKIQAAIEAGGRPSAEEQTAFWQAYDALTSALTPVSAFTVRETIRLRTTRGWRANPPRWLASTALVIFVISMWLQFLWVAGKELEDSTRALKKEQATLDAGVWRTRDEVFRLDQQHFKACVVPETRAAGSTSPDCKALNEKLQSSKAQDSMGSRELDRLNDNLNRQQGFMRDWYELCPAFLCVRSSEDEAIPKLKAERDEAAKRAADMEQPDGPFRDNLEYREKTKEWRKQQSAWRGAEQALQGAYQARSNAIEQRGHLLLAALGTYAIPMLLGWLGAITFMLRRLVRELNDATYSPISPSLGLVRMCLGMIVGVLGGLIVPSTGTNLPPLILPFIFGYGIEIVFAGLDKIVKAFTDSAPQR